MILDDYLRKRIMVAYKARRSPTGFVLFSLYELFNWPADTQATKDKHLKHAKELEGRIKLQEDKEGMFGVEFHLFTSKVTLQLVSGEEADKYHERMETYRKENKNRFGVSKMAKEVIVEQDPYEIKPTWQVQGQTFYTEEDAERWIKKNKRKQVYLDVIDKWKEHGGVTAEDDTHSHGGLADYLARYLEDDTEELKDARDIILELDHELDKAEADWDFPRDKKLEKRTTDFLEKYPKRD